jgi:hypothetical protein
MLAMTKVFIARSRHLSRLTANVKHRIDTMIRRLRRGIPDAFRRARVAVHC